MTTDVPAGKDAARPIPLIDPFQFIERGLLHEANRLFFHPLGLALIVEYDPNDVTARPKEFFILDYSDDPEGVIFEEIDELKCLRGQQYIAARQAVREKLLGFIVQPAPMIVVDEVSLAK